MRLMPPTVIDRNEMFRPPAGQNDLLALLFEAGRAHLLVTVHLEAWN